MASSVGQCAPVFLPGESPSLTEAYNVAKSQTLPKQPYMHRCKNFFFPVAALPQGELSVKVEKLLGLQGPWRHQVCSNTDCLHHRSYGPIRIFFRASCSWRSEGLFGQSFHSLRHLECSLTRGPSLLFHGSGTQGGCPGRGPTL